MLQKAYAGSKLQFHGRLADLVEPRRFQRLVAEARAHEWVVYAKPPFGGPEAVLKYLARYTHRIAISNHRLLSYADDQVSFTWKDYRHGHRRRVMVLDSVEFARRFLMHVLPKRFVKIRYYGFLAQSRRGAMLRRCREVLHVQPAAPDDALGEASHVPIQCDTSIPPEHTLCPSCHRGRLVYDHDVPPKDSS